jgi:hypothetical protein
MALRVTATTDGKYVGLTMPIDPRTPPAQVATADGAVFDPLTWDEIEPGKWKIRNAHYTVWAEEV